MPSRLLSARWSATMAVMRMIAAVVIGGVLALSQSGCSGAESGGLCPLSMNYNGETYYALKTEGRVQGQQPIVDVGFACLTDDEAGPRGCEEEIPGRVHRRCRPEGGLRRSLSVAGLHHLIRPEQCDDIPAGSPAPAQPLTHSLPRCARLGFGSRR